MRFVFLCVNWELFLNNVLGGEPKLIVICLWNAACMFNHFFKTVVRAVW